MLDNNSIVVIHMQHIIFKGNAQVLVVTQSNKKNPQEITVKSWNVPIISDLFSKYKCMTTDSLVDARRTLVDYSGCGCDH